MIALVHKGKVLCAIVFEFAGDPPHMFTATSDGAMMDGQPLVTNPGSVDKSSWIDCKALEWREGLYKTAELNGFSRSNLPPPNGYRLTQFAQGKLGLQICTDADAGEYDLVPGLFIAQQAGATVRNIGSTTWNPSNREVIAYWPDAQPGEIEAELLSFIT
jgi:fructose-1,6-bisphosphatase/inositol monophosphatase family enzyme